MTDSTTAARSRAADDVLQALTDSRDQAGDLGIASLTVKQISDETLFPEPAVRNALLELEGERLVIEVDADEWVLAAEHELTDDGRAGDDLDELEDGLDSVDGVDPQRDGPLVAEPYFADDGTPNLPARQVDQAELVDGNEGADAVAAWTQEDEDALGELERCVASGIRGFFEAGLALCEIRDRRLYRATHKRFEDYLQDRWDMGPSHGYRIIEAADVQKRMAPVGVTLARESHARELVNASDAVVQEVGRRLAQLPRVTAQVVVAQRHEVEKELVLQAIEQAAEPVSEEQLRGALGFNPYFALENLTKAGRVHRLSDSYPRRYAAGPPEYQDAKVTIPAATVARIAPLLTTGWSVAEWVLQAVEQRIQQETDTRKAGRNGDS